MELTSKNVNEVFKDCLFNDPSEATAENTTAIEGIRAKYGLQTSKLKEHEDDIFSMLMQLPKPFRKSVGGGWSFLNACMNDKEHQWTDAQYIMEQLFILGIGIGKVESLFPRKMWSILPGSVPYYAVIDK